MFATLLYYIRTLIQLAMLFLKTVFQFTNFNSHILIAFPTSLERVFHKRRYQQGH